VGSDTGRYVELSDKVVSNGEPFIIGKRFAVRSNENWVIGRGWRPFVQNWRGWREI